MEASQFTVHTRPVTIAERIVLGRSLKALRDFLKCYRKQPKDFQRHAILIGKLRSEQADLVCGRLDSAEECEAVYDLDDAEFNLLVTRCTAARHQADRLQNIAADMAKQEAPDG